MNSSSQTTPPSPAVPSELQHRYTAAMAGAIETRWQQFWQQNQTFRAINPGDKNFDPNQPKYYCLDMFPYPSGAGLHVGHPEGYTATDIISRYKRHCGFNVLHPMGWDAFGLPAEQYAIQTGVHPAVTTKQAIETFRRQLKRFGFSYDWSREFATIDENYYKWTQWIWLKAYNSWYDKDQDCARPIAELIHEFESGTRVVRLNPDAAEYAGAGDLPEGTRLAPWNEIDHDIRRMVIDSYRLAYTARQMVNWCPKLGTALANEEVIDGRSERGGYPVFRQPLTQWMFRITSYADRLLADLELCDWPESTRIMQSQWIGRSEGAEIDFPILDNNNKPTGEALRVFTTRPDTLFGATYMVVAPEHPLVMQAMEIPRPETDVDALSAYVEQAVGKTEIDRMSETKQKTGVFTGFYARNPATGKAIPVWTSDYVLTGYGTGAIMAVPGQDTRDWDFAEAFNLPIVRTVQPPADFDGDAYLGEGPAINSESDDVSLNGLHIADAKKRIIEWLEDTKRGMRKVNYKLRDWLFSRQRYWGEPFPIVFDERGEHYPVDEKHLPVKLPPLENYQPIESDEPQPMLAKATDWVKTTAGEAGVSPKLLSPDTPVTRETNTMPNWAGSCWYYLRFADNKNDQRFISKDAEQYWMGAPRNQRAASSSARSTSNSQNAPTPGVDLYIGGAEHAVLHLLYARFWHKILFDLGEVSTPEPFRKLFHQGMITSFAYQDSTGRTVPADEVAPREGKNYLIATGEEVQQITAKMSKTLKNVVNPDDVIAEFGADTFRLYEMYMGPLDASKPWNPRDISGLYRFLQRVWRVAVDENTGNLRLADSQSAYLEKLLHRTIARVADDIERLAFNTAIAALIEFTNAATAAAPSDIGLGVLTRDQLERFAIALSPVAPHMAEELWSKLGHKKTIAYQLWPTVDPALLRDDTIELPVQILGKVRARIKVNADADAKTVEQAVRADSTIKSLLEGKTVRKVIVVPGKIVNIVTG